MGGVFLSYSSVDRAFVRRLTGDLERAGHPVWQDERELAIGTDLGALARAIGGAEVVVVVLSRASAESDWVRHEVEVAGRLGVRVLPVLLEDAADWPADLRRSAHADFRSPRGYRRSIQRLSAAIDQVRFAGEFLSAKQAVALVRERIGPAGDLFGVSQQGVALVYSHVNSRHWEWADAADGSSRFWITEFYDRSNGAIESFAVVDGRVVELPQYQVLDPTKPREPGSIIVFSCALNPVPQISDDHPRRLIAENPEKFTQVRRRLVKYLPVRLLSGFVDSIEAIAMATDVALSMDRVKIHDDVLVLAALCCDKTNFELPTWRVSFFDPTLAESCLMVGIDPSTGEVRNHVLRSEILNSQFVPKSIDKDGKLALRVRPLMRAISTRPQDIPDDPTDPGWQLTAREAMTMAASALGSGPGWQIGFLSNTGVPRIVTSPDIRGAADGLLKRTGRAGQWVVDILSLSGEAVTDGTRGGTAYRWKQFVCTRKSGAVDVTQQERLILTSTLTPVTPAEFMGGFERACTLALATVTVEYLHLSVASTRPQGAVEWFFRFYNDRNIVARLRISADGRRLLDDISSSH